jgi:AhpC/TSA family
MKHLILMSLLAVASGTAFAAATVGQPAPAFSAQDTTGKTVALADFKGRHVVLEWVNPGCPFVQKHYGSANMQGTQKEAAAKGVVWLAINSTAEGAADYKAPAELAAWMQQQKAAASATLMDADGKVGRAYGADRPGRQSDLHRRHRQQAHRQPGRHRRRHQPRQAGAGRSAGRQTSQRGLDPALRLLGQVRSGGLRRR